METLIFKKNNYSEREVTIVLDRKTWEIFKKKGDKELYKKYNKHADYHELRIHVEEECLEIESHIMVEKKDEKFDKIKE